MVPYLSRKIFAIVFLAAVAIYSYATTGIQRGLDLQGGSRIVYSMDFEKAQAQGQIDPSEDRQVILRETVQILQKRVDASGLKDIPIYTQGENEIVLELPGMTQDQVDQVKSTIENQGRLQFRIVLTAASDDGLGLQGEIDKYKAWREAHPDEPVRNFNTIPEQDGGPRAGIQWNAVSPEKAAAGELPVLAGLDALPVRVEDVLRPPATAAESWNFDGPDLGSVGPSNDDAGFPAVRFAMLEHRKAAFADFTEQYTGRPMAIILNDVIESAPNINSRLPGGGIITGGSQGFAYEEMRSLITVLRTGSLKVNLDLESQSYVGPTLGADAIRLGVWSALAGGLTVLGFMILYFRINGLVACLALIFNGVILVGALAFSQATLTLPGLAGLVLTIGMAVDANILIFERVREERKRGREVTQAYKNGFERAFTTIVDANLTTLITGLILYQVGTGPVRGFAAVLSLGIITSMFSALVFSKVIMHFLVFSKKPLITEVKMARRLAGRAGWDFISMRKPALFISLVLIAGGLVSFFSQGSEMLGIDFTGGGMARVHLAQPTPISDVRASLGSGYSVSQLESRAPASAADISDTFIIKAKLTAADREAMRQTRAEAAGDGGGPEEEFFVAKVKDRLGPLLAEQNPFPESSTVGARVVDQIRDKAILAVFFSLIAIIIYMNFRFKEYRYGIAAVIALFHDVLFALGALAVFHSMGAVSIEINLEIIAAFLTIIGYSLNDTIVVFDRIRENLPRRSGSFPELINLSINQSLSRTVLTSITTFFVVAVLFFTNQSQHNVLEGFSFAMLIGVVVGTYSSIFIASPMLIFLDRWARKSMLGSPEKPRGAKEKGKGRLKPA